MNKKLDAIQTQLEDILTKAQNEIDDMEQSIRSANENEAQAAETIKKGVELMNLSKEASQSKKGG